MMFIIGSIAVATPAQAGETKVLKSKESRSFVSTNSDFDHPDLSTSANYINGEGTSNAGRFTFQLVNEFAPDKKSCTLPGGVAGAGTERSWERLGLRALPRRVTFRFSGNLRHGVSGFRGYMDFLQLAVEVEVLHSPTRPSSIFDMSAKASPQTSKDVEPHRACWPDDDEMDHNHRRFAISVSAH
jgi:hypothetical protein